MALPQRLSASAAAYAEHAMRVRAARAPRIARRDRAPHELGTGRRVPRSIAPIERMDYDWRNPVHASYDPSLRGLNGMIWRAPTNS